MSGKRSRKGSRGPAGRDRTPDSEHTSGQRKRKFSSSSSKPRTQDGRKGLSKSIRNGRKDPSSSSGGGGRGGADGEKPSKRPRLAPNAGKKKQPKKILTKAESKQARRERKRAKQSPAVLQANQLSLVPIKQIPAAERQAKIGDILSRIEGDYSELGMRRDTTRVLQNMIKYGSVKHKTKIVENLKGAFLKLTLDRHGVWLVLKILQHGKDSFTQLIAEEIFPHLVRVGFHATGAQVVDYLFMMDGQDRNLTLQRRVNILLYFLAPEFRVFDSKLRRFKLTQLEAACKDIISFAVRHLSASDADPEERKKDLLDHLRNHLTRVLTKQHLMFRFNHNLLASYLQTGDPESSDYRELRAELHTNLLALRNTAPGVAVACQIVRMADARGRKHIVKGLGDEIPSLAMDTYAWKILATLFHFTDDTVLLRKKVLKPLETMDILASRQGCQLFLWILTAARPSYFPAPDIQAILGQLPKLQKDGKEDRDAQRIQAVQSIVSEHSKKDYLVRRAELLDECHERLLAALTTPELVELALSDRNSTADLLCEAVVEAVQRITSGKQPESRVQNLRGLLEQVKEAVVGQCEASVRAVYSEDRDGEEEEEGDGMEDDDDDEKGGDSDANEEEEEDEGESSGDDASDSDDSDSTFAPQTFGLKDPNHLLQNVLRNKQKALAERGDEAACVLDTLAHFTVKRILSTLQTGVPEIAADFAIQLFRRAYTPALDQLLESSRACFVLREALDALQAEKKTNSAALKEILSALKPKQDVLAKSAKERPGCKVLHEFLTTKK